MIEGREQPQKKASRREREAAALRQNLGRRKAQQRLRGDDAEDGARAAAADESARSIEKKPR